MPGLDHRDRAAGGGFRSKRRASVARATAARRLRRKSVMARAPWRAAYTRVHVNATAL
jgi:hypothetical protein